MAKVLIGNFMGPQGPVGPKGEQGIQGIQGVQGIPGKIQSVWGATSDETGDAKPEIGGRNYARNTSDDWQELPRPWNNEYMSVLVGENEEFHVGDKFTVSVEVDNTESVTSAFGFFMRFTPTTGPDNLVNSTVVGPGDRGKLCKTFTIPENATVFRVLLGYSNAPSDHAKFRCLKVEKGNVPTDWSPSPQDMIGGRNYILNSKGPFHREAGSSNYSFSEFILSTNVNRFDELVFSAKNVTVTGNIFTVTILDINNSQALGTANITVEPGQDCYCKIHITDKSLDALHVLVYTGVGGSTAGKTIDFEEIKLEQGAVPTDWSPAPEDLPKKQTFTSTVSFSDAAAGAPAYAESGEYLKDYIAPALDTFANDAIPNIEDNTAATGILYTYDGPIYGISYLKISGNRYGGVVFGYTPQIDGLILFGHTSDGYWIVQIK